MLKAVHILAFLSIIIKFYDKTNVDVSSTSRHFEKLYFLSRLLSVCCPNFQYGGKIFGWIWLISFFLWNQCFANLSTFSLDCQKLAAVGSNPRFLKHWQGLWFPYCQRFCLFCWKSSKHLILCIGKQISISGFQPREKVFNTIFGTVFTLWWFMSLCFKTGFNSSLVQFFLL